jgi:hypothetical protein
MKHNNKNLINLTLIDIVYKPVINNKFQGSLSNIRKKINFFKTKLNSNIVISNFKNNTPPLNNITLLFKKYFVIVLTFKLPVLIKQLFFDYNKQTLFNITRLSKALSNDFLYNTNLLPSTYFNYTFKKMIVLFRSNLFLKANLVP